MYVHTYLGLCLVCTWFVGESNENNVPDDRLDGW